MSLPGTMRALAGEVCATHKITLAELTGHSTAQRLVQVRHEFMWKARAMTREDGRPRFSFPQIGRFLGRDHTSVIHGMRRYAERQAAEASKEAA